MLKQLLPYEWAFWLIACTLSVFLSPNSSPVLFMVFALALPCFALLRWWVGLPVFPNFKLAIPLMGLLIMIALSVAITPDIAFSLRKISGLINSIGLFIALIISSKKNIPSWLLLIFGIVIASVGAIGSDIYARIPLFFPVFRLFYLVVPFLPNVQRVINANLVAGALLWTLPVSAGICWFYWRKKAVLLAGGAAVAVFVQLFMLIIMQSRAALLALFISGLSVVWVLVPFSRRFIQYGILILAACILLLVLPIWPTAFTSTLQDAYFTLLVKGDEGEQGLDSIDGRIKIWQRSLDKISEKPVGGHGLNIFRTIVNDPTPVFVPEKEVPHAHNWALQIILELGLIGLFFYLWLLFKAFQILHASWYFVDEQRPVIVGYAAALLAFMIFGLFDTISPGARPDFIFWILLAGAFNRASKHAIRPEKVEADR